MKTYSNLIFQFFAYILATIALTSCTISVTPTYQSTIRVEDINNCIDPLYGGFSYPVEANSQDILIPGLNMFVLPPTPWDVEILLPEFPGLTNWEQRHVGVIQTRKRDDYFEIWVHISPGLEKQGYLAVYRTDVKRWAVIPESIDTLFVDKNGSLWGSHWGYYGVAYKDAYGSILSRFDEKTGAFVPDINLPKLPFVVEKDDNYFYSKVVFGTGEEVWILVPLDGIYKYDLISKDTKKVRDFPFLFSDAEISGDGEIIYLLINNQVIKDDALVYQSALSSYSINTGKIFNLPLNDLLEPYPYPYSLLIDHEGGIWLDNIAYKNREGGWQQLKRSSLFLSAIKEFNLDHRYRRADIVLESSDGKLWFLHQNGMISLDPDKGEWCWFTTYQSNIVEDADGNLWMIADGKLYKYLLQP